MKIHVRRSRLTSVEIFKFPPDVVQFRHYDELFENSKIVCHEREEWIQSRRSISSSQTEELAESGACASLNPLELSCGVSLNLPCSSRSISLQYFVHLCLCESGRPLVGPEQTTFHLKPRMSPLKFTFGRTTKQWKDGGSTQYSMISLT